MQSKERFSLNEENSLYDKITTKLSLIDNLRNTCRVFTFLPESLKAFWDCDFYCSKCNLRLFDFSHIKLSKCIIYSPDKKEYYLYVTQCKNAKCELKEKKVEASIIYHSIKCSCKSKIGVTIVECILPISNLCEKMLINIEAIYYNQGDDHTAKSVRESNAFISNELTTYVEALRTSSHVSSLITQYFIRIYKLLNSKQNI